MSSEEQAAQAELERLLSDRLWRLNNLYWIVDNKGRRVQFRLNWAQEELLRDVWYCNLNLKARQIGITTFWCIVYLDICVFNPNIRCGLIAHNLNDARAIFSDKIKFPYEQLPDAIRAVTPPIRDSALELALANNSSVRVGTSLRSGTLQYLHVSELGKIAAKYPEKAREIRTGALNTLTAGQYVSIESTAEGAEGDFYELCEEAQSMARLGARLTPLDFKFFFFPWWREPSYRLDPDGVVIGEEFKRYFDKLALEHGIHLDAAQKAWYVTKAKSQQGDMKREFPSFPQEAFEASVEGAYYSEHMAYAELEGRIGTFDVVPGFPVHTASDIGRRDYNPIWFFQFLPGRIRLLHFFQSSGEAMPFYAEYCRKLYERTGWPRGADAVDYFPHDARVEEWGSGKTRLEQLTTAGWHPKIPTEMSLHDGINAVRTVLGFCEFDAEGCSEGIKALKNYRKTWNDDRGIWSDMPFHNWASHGADAMRIIACAHREITAPVVDPEQQKQEELRKAREERLKAAGVGREMRTGQ